MILDTVADLFGGNEINRIQVRQFIQNACGTIARMINGAVLVCAHPSDSGMQRGSGVGGSTAWNNYGLDHVGIFLNLLRKGVCQRREFYLVKKSNYSAGGGEIHMLWQDWAFERVYSEQVEKKEPKITGEKRALKYELERDRKRDIIIDLIEREALEGRIYNCRDFSGKFEDVHMLGSDRTIHRVIANCVDKGLIHILDNYDDYNLPAPPKSSQGYIYIDGMELKAGEQKMNPDTGEMESVFMKISKKISTKGEITGDDENE